MIRRIPIAILFITLLMMPAVVFGDEPAATQPAGDGKALRLLFVGNSFSHNSSAYLPAMAKEAGHSLTLGYATISGASFERHVRAAQLHDANPDDPAGRPYTLTLPDTSRTKVSLRELLVSEPWDYVVIHQASFLSFKLDTYHPHARILAEYIRGHAPAAQLLILETWPYRADHKLYTTSDLTPDRMYAQLHAAYATLAGELDAPVLPVGAAIRAVLHDPRWTDELPPPIDPAAFEPPAPPPQTHSLFMNAYWNTGTTPPTFVIDAAHLSPPGRYLASAVVYEFLFGDVTDNPHAPHSVTPEDAALLRDIARSVVSTPPRADRH